MVFVREDAHNVMLTADADHLDYGRARRRVFFLTTLAVLAAGVLVTLLQPSRYVSTATVLMSAPVAIDEQMLEADVQGVAIQRRTLTGSDITRRLVDVLASEHAIVLTVPQLRDMLDVRAVPETNLVELAAFGSEPAQLPLLLERWIEVYTGVRAREIETRKTQTLMEVEQELTGLAARLQAARDALETYRRDKDIISMERQENAVMAQLDGLNAALNRAVEEEVRSRAYRDTLKDALAAGEQVVPEPDRGEIAVLSQSLADLRARLDELRTRYTDDYIRKAPQFRALPEQIALLQEEIDQARAQRSRTELATAERAYQTARESVANLERRLALHKEAVVEFNTVYAQHQALVEDLSRLEELNRETQARQVQIVVSQVEQYPQVSVVDWPAGEAQRIGLPLVLLLGGSMLGAIVAGIFGVWLYSYLHPRPAPSQLVALSGLTLYPRDNGRVLEQGARPPDRLIEDRT